MPNFMIDKYYCDKGHGPLVATGYGECNTPLGHDMIYEMYQCTANECQQLIGVPTGIRFKHESPNTIVFLDLNGNLPVRIPWFNLRRWLYWNVNEWVKRDEPTYEGSRL